MPIFRRHVAVLALAGLTFACRAPATETASPAETTSAGHDLLFAVAWLQTSAEYEAAALGTYQSAAQVLERALADSTWTAAIEQQGDFAALPPAIIVDVDETVLDNSAYQARLIAHGGGFAPDTWGAWIDERKGTAIPGAVEFLTAAAGRGVRIFYVSNRDAAQAEATRDNLARLGFPDAANLDTFYFRDSDRGWRDKSPRRAEVARAHRVLFLFGDNLFDFVEAEKPNRAARAALVGERAAWWGTRWFMLPNPMYGSWDDVLIDYDRSKSLAEAHEARARSLGRAE